MSPDPHHVLGVRHGASYDEVLAAYRRAAFQAHPDHGGSSHRFRQVREAYEYLVAKVEAQDLPAEADVELPEVLVTPAMAKVGAIVRVPMPRWADCETCSGTGVAKHRRTCSACVGSGQVSEAVRTHEFVLPCAPCEGTGYVGHRCQECARGKRFVSMQRKVRLPVGTLSGQVLHVGGVPAFVVKVIEGSS